MSNTMNSIRRIRPIAPAPVVGNISTLLSTLHAVKVGATTSRSLAIAFGRSTNTALGYGNTSTHLAFVRRHQFVDGRNLYGFSDLSEQMLGMNNSDLIGFARHLIRNDELVRIYENEGMESLTNIISHDYELNPRVALRRAGSVRMWAKSVGVISDKEITRALNDNYARMLECQKDITRRAELDERRFARVSRTVFRERMDSKICPVCFTILAYTGRCDSCADGF